MPQNELEWTLKLTDKVTDPSKRIQQSLSGVLDKSQKLQVGWKNLGRDDKGRWTKPAQAFDKYNKKLGEGSGITSALSAGWGKMAAAATGAAAAVLSVSTAIAVVNTASTKRNTLAAFTVLSGSADEAKSMYEQITKIADVAPFETKDVGAMFRSLLGGGFKRDEIENTLKGVFDVGAIIGGSEGQQAAQSIVQTMLQIRSLGKLTFEDMKQISQAAGGLIPIDKLAAQIGKIRKVTSEQALKMISEGKITAAEGQAALLATIQETADKGAALGTASLEFGTKSVEGTLSTLKSRFSHLLENINLDPLVSVINKINAAFASPAGVRAAQVLTKMFDDLLAKIDELVTAEAVEGVINGIIDVLGLLRKYFEADYEVVSSFFQGIKEGIDIIKFVFDQMGGFSKQLDTMFGEGKGIKTFVGQVAQIARAIGWVTAAFGAMAVWGSAMLYYLSPWGWIQDVTKDWQEAMSLWLAEMLTFNIDVVQSFVSGFWNALVAGWNWLIEKFKGLLELLPESVKTVLGIHSDSRVMKGLAGHAVGGFESGLLAGMPAVGSAIDSMVAPPVAPMGGGAMFGGGPMSFGDISFSFGGGPADQNEAREYGRTAAYEFKQTVAKLMSGAAVETGAG